MIFITWLFVYISHLGISKKVKDKYGHIEPMLDTSKETMLVKHAGITDASCSKNTDTLDNLIVSVKQGILIQHLEEKTRKMLEKITRMELVSKMLDADHQETLQMLNVAEVHTCGVYNVYIDKTALHIILNRFLDF